MRDENETDEDIAKKPNKERNWTGSSRQRDIVF